MKRLSAVGNELIFRYLDKGGSVRWFCTHLPSVQCPSKTEKCTIYCLKQIGRWDILGVIQEDCLWKQAGLQF